MIPGCTQYYTGTSNYFNSYNYAGGVQLANQKQNVCMRFVIYETTFHSLKFQILNSHFLFSDEKEGTAGKVESGFLLSFNSFKRGNQTNHASLSLPGSALPLRPLLLP